MERKKITKESYEILKEAIARVGAKKIAAQLHLSQALIYKWCQRRPDETSYPLPSGAMNPLDRIRLIYEETQDPEILNWLCKCADGYFVKNISEDDLTYDYKVLKNIQKFIQEFSETLDVISQSYSNDKRIDKKEAEAIRKEWEELKRSGEGFVRACEMGKFDKKRK